MRSGAGGPYHTQEVHTKPLPVLLSPKFSNSIFAILLPGEQKEDNYFPIYSYSLSSIFFVKNCDMSLKLIILKVSN